MTLALFPPFFSRLLPVALLSTLSLSVGTVARASEFDLFGVHPVGVAEVSARVASADDGSASFYNPGGLSFGKGNQFEVSARGLSSMLEVQESTVPINDGLGGTITAAVAVPLEGPLHGRIRVGLAMSVMASGLMHLTVRERVSPFFPYYDNRTQRVVAIPALSVRLLDRLGVGVGVNVLAGVRGQVEVVEGQSRTLEPRVVQEAGTVLRWIAGVRYDVSDGVQLGLTYRKSFGVPLSIATKADIAGFPLTVDLTKAEALYDPETLVGGARLKVSEDVAGEINVAVHRWSAWEGPALGLDTQASALALSSRQLDQLFRDTLSMKVGVEWTVERKPACELSVHVGAGYESSMLDSSVPQGEVNLVDGAKLMFGAGVSARFPGVVGSALRIGVGAQLHHVLASRQKKIACTIAPCPAGTVVGPSALDPSADISNPGYPSLSGGGKVLVGSFGLGVDL